MTGEPLHPDYELQSGCHTEFEYNDMLCRFRDASLYQTYSYGATIWGENAFETAVLKYRGDVCALCLVRAIRTPIFLKNVAYIANGPVWKGRDRVATNDFRQMLRALRREYVDKRGMYLRIAPNIAVDEDVALMRVLSDEGFSAQSRRRPYRTFVIDLAPEIDDLKMQTLHKKWREKLNRANRSDLEVEISSSDDAYGTFLSLHKEMFKRKQFVKFVSEERFRDLQERLPEELELKIGIAYSQRQPVAALVWSDIGMKGVSIFSAVGDKGMKLRGAYLLRWKMLLQLKESGCSHADLGGIDPLNNPGGYEFRAGMGGTDVTHIGDFDTWNGLITRFLFWGADWLRWGSSMLRLRVNRIKRQWVKRRLASC